MKAHLNRIVSLLLLCMIFVNTSGIAYATKPYTNSITTYNVPLSSNEYPEQTTIAIYEFNDKYFISIETIAQLTRFSYNETETHLVLIQGLREVEIEKSSGHLIDSDYIDQGNIELLEQGGQYYCEGIPMLLYLGAACGINNQSKLEILMPAITIWESIMPNYLDLYFNIVELYGGETNVKISLACDILSDILDAVSGHGLKADGDTHLEDALYEILNVDMSKYGSVQEQTANDNKKVQNFLKTNEELIVKSGENGKDVASEIIENYLDFYFNSKISAAEFKWQTAYRAGDMTEASKLSSMINQQIYDQSIAKVNLNKAGDILNIGVLAFSTALTSYNLMQYDEVTRSIFKRTINKEMMDYVNYHDISWNNVTDKISRTLSSNASIVGNTTVDSIVEFITEEISEKGVEIALSGFVEKANIYMLALEISQVISSLINSELHEAYSADMNAIWLSTVQYDVAQLTARLLVNEAKNNGCRNFGNIEYLQKVQDLFILYYRTTIAFAENMAISIEKFGGRNKADWVRYFSDTSEPSVSNYVATYLYRMTNCTIIPIVKYDELKDTLISREWIENFMLTKEEQDRDIYTHFLLNGGYEEILGSTYDLDSINLGYLDISTCLANFDSDSNYELLISLTITEFAGPRGYPCTCALLDIQNGNVQIVTNAYYGGGTMGGDYLDIKYDTVAGKHVIVLDGYIRDGTYATKAYLNIYSTDGLYNIEKKHEQNYLNRSISYYDDEAGRISRETMLYKESGEDFYYWCIDENYVDEIEYTTAVSRFSVPVDEAYTFKHGTYDVPINLSNLKKQIAVGNDFFAQLPSEFVFASGVGGWYTEITLSSDGTFTGQYSDSEMGDIGNGYPNGTVYICNFDGKFSFPQQLDDYICSMTLEYLNTIGNPGSEYYENGIRYICSNPYGFDDADKFLIYLPGCPLDKISEDFLSWASIDTGIRSTLPSGFYGIYNIGGMEGFVGLVDNNLWSKDYLYNYGSYRSALWPRYSNMSHLVFWPESGAAILDLCFKWSDDSQSNFIATDSRGTGDYSISLSFHDDYNTVLLKLKSYSEYDLSPWGGETDGTLTAEYSRSSD